MKIIFRLLLFFFLVFFIFIAYLTIFGIETKRFNAAIEKNFKNINQNLDIQLNKVQIIFEPLDLKIKIKTIGPKLKNNNKIIELESIKSQIPIKYLIKNQFLIESVDISTNSIEIKNLISFLRSFENKPELFILEKIVKRGFLIADIKLEFDAEGLIKDNYKINGFIKDTKISFLKRFDLQKLNLIFEYKKNDLLLNDIAFSINNLNFLSERISIKKDKNEFLVKGELNNKQLEIDKKSLSLFIKNSFSEVDFEKLIFSSDNVFSFKINNKLELENLIFESKMLIDELIATNEFDFARFLPNLNKNLKLSNHDLSIKYTKGNLNIDGKGDILLQNENDIINYSINKKKKSLNFKTSLKLNSNPFKIDLINYEKNQNKNALIQLEGSINDKKKFFIKSLSVKEDQNSIIIESLLLNKKLEINKIGLVDLDYIDKEEQKNQIKFYAKQDEYYLDGSFFNANTLIDDLLFNDKNSVFFNLNNKVNVNIDKILLDNEYNLSNFTGSLVLKNKEIIKADLTGDFSNDSNLKFTINTIDNTKITTLYAHKAKPFVKRYKFIKGFDNGLLDFNSRKKSDETISQLKIYDFKLKELPVLTKILTLASLQGIADILSGEGIGFDEFEMNFKNKKDSITIEEMYATGPAISILMSGYVEKEKLISLRGTLVPATTVNKVIGSIPILGDILVGSKTGEGVFGVSFKIKGPPKELETTVNPIKTLTPRFITRTLEKIKKTN